MGTDKEESELNLRVMGLRSAAPERVVQFLYPVLNGLISLLVQPTLSKEATTQVQQSAFATMAHIVRYIQSQLNLHSDKHEHNTLLATYLQHIMIAPTGHSSQAPPNKYSTLGTQDEKSPKKERVQASGSVRIHRVIGTSLNPTLLYCCASFDRFV